MNNTVEEISQSPELKIFLSVDVINSTEYKNQKPEGVQPWLSFFRYFYRDFSVVFKHKCEALKQDETAKFHGIPEVTPEIWKTAGDEIVFKATLTHYKQARLLTMAFKAALEEYNKSIHVYIKSDADKLQLKGAAWLAGFPVGNARVTIDETKQEDYIGPLVDIGFRISKYAEKDFLVVSVDLSLLLIRETLDPDFNLVFFFMGKKTLKGVVDHYGRSIDYPIIGIKINNTISDPNLKNIVEIENEISSDKYNKFEQSNQMKYCESIINYIGPPLMIPFIENDTVFGTKPPNYAEDLKQIQLMHRDYTHNQTVVGSEEEQKGDQTADSFFDGIDNIT